MMFDHTVQMIAAISVMTILYLTRTTALVLTGYRLRQRFELGELSCADFELSRQGLSRGQIKRHIIYLAVGVVIFVMIGAGAFDSGFLIRF